MLKNPKPIIITNRSVHSEWGKECGRECPSDDDCVCDCDCDCACSTENTIIGVFPSDVENFISQTFLDSTEYTINPDLFIDKINNDFFLVFPFLSNIGIVVLNNLAKLILDLFTKPKKFCDVKCSIEDVSDFDLSVCVKRLAELSLIIRNGTKSLPNFAPSSNLTTWLQITDDCNLRCSYCYLPKQRSVMTMDIGEKAISTIIKTTKDNSLKKLKIKFSGGEATNHFSLVMNLYDFAKAECQRANLELQGVILSNGVSISDSMIDNLQERNLHLMISLDGINSFHNATRIYKNGKGSFSAVEKSLNRLLDRAFFPEISITITNKNILGLADTVSYLLRRNLMFSINFFRDNDLVVDTELYFDKTSMIEGLRKAFKVIESEIPAKSFLGSIADRANFLYPHNKTCGVGDNYLVIDTKGFLSKCQMAMSNPIANIKESTDPLSIIRTDSKGIQNINVDEKQGCNHCNWRYWCAGGCPIYTFRAMGRYDAISPNCEIYKEIFPDILRLEAHRILKYSQLYLG